MSLLERIRGLFAVGSPRHLHIAGAPPPAPLPDIGTPEPMCPHCSHRFPKMPQRKTKCPSCGEFAYSRIRPSDKRKVLLRASDLDAFAEQWAIANGTHVEFLRQKERRVQARADLREPSGAEPSEADISLHLLQLDAAEHAKDNNWGLYRNDRFSAGEVLAGSLRFLEALREYLAVCYLDLNGSENRGGLQHYRELASDYPPFDPSHALLAPGILHRCRRLIKDLQLAPTDVERAFLQVAVDLRSTIDLPILPAAAWAQLSGEIDVSELGV